MRHVTNLAGRKFGHWTVLARVNDSADQRDGHAIWLCRCDCGTVRNVNGNSLRLG